MKPLLIVTLVIVGLALAAFLIPCTNTSTLCGRWLMWREPSIESHIHYPSTPVLNDPNNIFTFPTATPPSALTDFTYAGQPLDKFLEANDTVAFIVVRDGAVMYERYLNGAQRDSQFTAFSVTKSYLSALVGLTIQQGHIHSVTDPVTRYLPELSGAGFDTVTLEHLLQMSSGVQWSREKIFGAPAWWSDFYKASFAPDMRDTLLGLKLTQPPLEKYTYNSYNAGLIGLILERATGTPVPEYLQTNLWQPLGAEYAATWTLDSQATQFARMDGGLNVRAIDLAKFGQLFLQNGQWQGQPLISADWVTRSTTDQGNDLLPRQLAQLTNLPADLQPAVLGMRYYYFWWGAERDNVSAFYANGDKGQFIYIVPAERLVIVRLGRSWGAGRGDEHWTEFFYTLVNAIKEP